MADSRISEKGQALSPQIMSGNRSWENMQLSKVMVLWDVENNMAHFEICLCLSFWQRKRIKPSNAGLQTSRDFRRLPRCIWVFALLDCYKAYVGRCFPTFRDSQTLTVKQFKYRTSRSPGRGPIGCPETSVYITTNMCCVTTQRGEDIFTKFVTDMNDKISHKYNAKRRKQPQTPFCQSQSCQKRSHTSGSPYHSPTVNKIRINSQNLRSNLC
jgi:hypothetical protein